MIAGTNVASLLLIALSTLLVKGLLSIDTTVFALIKVCGVAYVGYLGVQLLRDARRPVDVPGIAPVSGGFARGFAMSISNPKDIVFFASLFPQFLAITPNPDTSRRC